MINRFLPGLVTAVSDCVQPVSDQCLAEELISESVYDMVLELRETSKDKARALILAVRKSIKTDSSHLEKFLSILKQQVTCHKLLTDMKTYLKKSNTCGEVVPIHVMQNHVQLGSTEQVPRETALLQSTLLGSYEDSIRQHERIRSEKERLEEKLKEKTEECDRLKEELKALKNQTKPADEAVALTQSRLTACEGEVETLKAKFCHLENTLEEKDIQVQEERNTVITVGRNILEMFENAQKENKDLQSKLVNQERENKEAYVADRLKLGHLNPIILSLTLNHPQPSFWKRLGEEVGFSMSELEDIKRIPRYKIIVKRYWKGIPRLLLWARKPDDWYRLEEMLRQWLIQYPGDQRGSTNFPAYSKLHTSLVKIEVGRAASDLVTYNSLTSYYLK